MLKFPDLIKHLKKASTIVCGERLFYAAAAADISFKYRGKAYYIVNLLKAPSLTLNHWVQVRVALKYPNVIKQGKKAQFCCPLYYFFPLQGLG